MSAACTNTPSGEHRGIGGFGYCTECGYRPAPTAPCAGCSDPVNHPHAFDCPNA